MIIARAETPNGFICIRAESDRVLREKYQQALKSAEEGLNFIVTRDGTRIQIEAYEQTCKDS